MTDTQLLTGILIAIFLTLVASCWLFYLLAKWKFQAQRDRAIAVATESLRLAAGLLERMTIPGPVKSEVEGIMDEMQGAIISIQGLPK